MFLFMQKTHAKITWCLTNLGETETMVEDTTAMLQEGGTAGTDLLVLLVTKWRTLWVDLC